MGATLTLIAIPCPYAPSRAFSSQFDDQKIKAVNRSIDNDAPAGLRQEFVDAVYLVFERQLDLFNEQRLHQIILGSLGVTPSANPHGGYRRAIAREVGKAEWK